MSHHSPFIVSILIISSLCTQAISIDLPDATARVLVFSDQLNDNPQTANFEFNAAHFVGMQKIDRAKIQAYKAINPKFIAVQYHKSYGVDLGENITSADPPYWNKDCDTFYAWVNRHPEYGPRESYYLHYGGVVDSVHRIKHYWNNINEYYLADLRTTGWRTYIAEETVRRCTAMGFDGAFFDCSYFPSYGYEPDTWCTTAPWNVSSITQFGNTWNDSFAVPYWNCIRTYYHSSGRDFLCLPNCDQMVTGWYEDAYMDYVDGGMVEGFFTYGGKLTGGDWQLSAGRILKYITGAGKNRVLLAQCSPDPANMSLRRWCIANYFLVKNRYSYYNIAAGSTANWWPEYEIALDSFVTQPSQLNDLLVQGTASLYRRDFKSGMVLVNPGSSPQSLITARRFKPVTFSGGGMVSNGVPPVMSVTYGDAVTGQLTVNAGEVLILQEEGAIAISSPRPKKAYDPVRRGETISRIYDCHGRLIGVLPQANGKSAAVLKSLHSNGMYIICDSNGTITRRSGLFGH